MSSDEEIATRADTSGDAGTLYLVSTPIGNLGDMTFRAVEVLSSAALIVAEDTRHSRRLLDHFEIDTPVKAYHEHNEAKETPRLIARLRAGDSIALISDAGTPLISDPGHRLVAAAIGEQINIVPIPGPSAVMTALVASGMPLERFTYYGFVPRGGRDLTETLEDIITSQCTSVVFESPNRLHETLSWLVRLGAGERSAVVGRELTKKFEEFKRGSLAELATYYGGTVPKGEIVLVIAGAAPPAVSESELTDLAEKMRQSGKTSREVMSRLRGMGAPRNLAYKIAHED